MKPTPDELADALRAASRSLGREGEGMLMTLIVVTVDDGNALVSSASNMPSPSTRRRVLEIELEREGLPS